MAVQRFRSETEQTRLVLGAILMAFAVGFAAFIAALEIRARRVNVTGIVFYAILYGIFALGRRLFRPRDLFEIDVEHRTYAVIRNGQRAGSGPLDALGPLQISHREYHSYTGTSTEAGTTWTEFAVTTAVFSSVALYTARRAAKARRKMESLARAWQLPSRSLGGMVRTPDQLDMPVHERLRDDAAARAESPLRPEWGLRVEPLSLGYAIHSTQRQWASLRIAGFIVVVMLFSFRGSFKARSILDALAEGRTTDDPVVRVLTGLLAVVLLVFLWFIVKGIRDFFFPGTVRITDGGVSYRGSRMRLREIEEVLPTFPIELIGDRRSLILGETFCTPAATATVAHEIQRLIIEVAEANPHARSA